MCQQPDQLPGSDFRKEPNGRGEKALKFRAKAHGDTPKLRTIRLIVCVCGCGWLVGGLTMGYSGKIIEGDRRLRQLPSITEAETDLRRAAQAAAKKRGGSRNLYGDIL